MTDPLTLFDIEQLGEILMLMPSRNLSEFELSSFEQEVRCVAQQLDTRAIKNVVLDFSKTDYYGSTALSLFLVLWKQVRSRNGQMAFCHVSAHEKEVLELTRLDGLWPIYDTRQEAVQGIRSRPKAENGYDGSSARRESTPEGNTTKDTKSTKDGIRRSF